MAANQSLFRGPLYPSVSTDADAVASAHGSTAAAAAAAVAEVAEDKVVVVAGDSPATDSCRNEDGHDDNIIVAGDAHDDIRDKIVGHTINDEKAAEREERCKRMDQDKKRAAKTAATTPRKIRMTSVGDQQPRSSSNTTTTTAAAAMIKGDGVGPKKSAVAQMNAADNTILRKNCTPNMSTSSPPPRESNGTTSTTIVKGDGIGSSGRSESSFQQRHAADERILLYIKQSATMMMSGDPPPTQEQEEEEEEEEDGVDVMALVNYRARVANFTSGDDNDGEDDEPAIREGSSPRVAARNRQETDPQQPGAYAECFGSRVRRTDSLGTFDSEELAYETQSCVDTTSSSPNNDSDAITAENNHPMQDNSSIVEARPVPEDEELGGISSAVNHHAQPFDVQASEKRKLKSQYHQRKQLLGICLIVFVPVLVLVGVLLGTQTVGGSDDNTDDGDDSPAVITQQLNSPTAAPSVPAPLTDLLAELPQYTMDSIQNDPSSPQYRGYHWLQDHRDISTMPMWRQKQLLAMASFYYAFNGTNWPFGLDKDWLDDERSECDWFSHEYGTIEQDDGGNGGFDYKEKDGARVCNDDGALTALELTMGKTREWIDLTIHNFTMPPEISFLTALERIKIDANFPGASLADFLPSQISNMSNLTSIDYGRNELHGSIPSWLWSMTQLQNLILYKNDDVTGTIPTHQLALMTNLQELDLEQTSINGQLPTELGVLTQSTELSFGRTSLNDTIPSELGLLQNLTSLDLFKTSIAGPFPSELGLLTQLTSLDLSDTAITGSLPNEVGSLSFLKSFQIGSTSLGGPVPIELASLTSLTSLSLANTSLTGGLPSELGLFSNLTYLNLSHSNFSGTIPMELGGLVVHHKLRVLDLSNATNLVGSIPQELCELQLPSCSYYEKGSKSSSGESVDEKDLESCSFDFDCKVDLCGCDCPCPS